MTTRIILVEDLLDVPDGGTFPVPANVLVSDLAREEAEKRGIVLEEAPSGRIALGADHGGFAMKEKLKAYLSGLGFDFHDFGSFDEKPVDYPDIAAQVALAVSRGNFQFGIILDGAGIGSCMAANRVPGVLAALCYDEATARNSREHNYANVLTLGARMLSEEQLKSVVKTWLSTPYGEARHKRRVDKILALEKRFR